VTKEEARKSLEEIRGAIDEMDRSLVALLNARARVVEEIGRVKREAQMPVYEPDRENQVFANIAGANSGPLPEDAMRRIFERIIDEMRNIQAARMESGTEPGA
jgi:chorismate mutase